MHSFYHTGKNGMFLGEAVKTIPQLSTQRENASSRSAKLLLWGTLLKRGGPRSAAPSATPSQQTEEPNSSESFSSPEGSSFCFFLITQTSVPLPFGEHGELGTQEDSPANSENCWAKTRRQEKKKGTTDQSDNKDCSRGPQQNSSRNPRSSEVELWWPWLMFWFPGRPTRRSLH